MMKHSIRSLLILALAAATITGCKKNPYGVTPLSGRPGAPMSDNASGLMGTASGVPVEPGAQATSEKMKTPEGYEQPDLTNIDANYNQDPAPLKAQTVYFDFDSSAVKVSEQGKLNAVADFLNSNPRDALLIEGNCDERGTEEYNRALGERRALALREYLINSGISADRMVTRSYGEDRPVDPGHDQAAWAKNRRGDFVVLVPKQ